jgi:hypothetical protein
VYSPYYLQELRCSRLRRWTGQTYPTSTAAAGHRIGLSENPRTASSGPKSALLAGPELLLTLGKQTSALGLKAASQVGSKVGGFVSDLKDNITSNLASATGTEQCCGAKRRVCMLYGRCVLTCTDSHNNIASLTGCAGTVLRLELFAKENSCLYIVLWLFR